MQLPRQMTSRPRDLALELPLPTGQGAVGRWHRNAGWAPVPGREHVLELGMVVREQVLGLLAQEMQGWGWAVQYGGLCWCHAWPRGCQLQQAAGKKPQDRVCTPACCCPHLCTSGGCSLPAMHGSCPQVTRSVKVVEMSSKRCSPGGHCRDPSPG